MIIPYTEKDLLYDLDKINLEFEPGTKFSYSNLGYGIVGYICERVSNKSYAELIDKYISKVYGMPNTTVKPSNKQLKSLVTPYRKDDNTTETKRYLMGKLSSAGGVYSNINDISTLMINQIKAYREQSLTKQTGFNPLILTKSSDRDSLNYGFGLGKMVFESGTQYGHGGDMDGFASTYVFSPEFNLGVIILTSSGGRWIGELEKQILYKLTNRKYIAPKKSVVEKFAKLVSKSNFKDAEKWLTKNKDSKEYYLNEAEMNNLGYMLKEIQKAIAIFKLNTNFFPNSYNVYDSLGEAYVYNKQYDLGIENYKKSLELNPKNKNAEVMLGKIEKLK